MTKAKNISDIIAELPLIQQLSWLYDMQEKIRQEVNLSFPLLLSLSKGNVVVLASNAAFAKKIEMIMPTIEQIFFEHDLIAPKVLVRPFKFN
jgi:hypothetical protein